MTLKTSLHRHVTFCPQGDGLQRSGKDAENATVQFLVDNLQTHLVGDYRILAGYNLPLRGPGSVGALEVDVLLINKFGLFAIEVKDWYGTIDARDDGWYQNRGRMGNVFVSVINKAKVLKGHIRRISPRYKVGVIGLIVLARGRARFNNYTSYDDRIVVELNSSLLAAVSSNLFWGFGYSDNLLLDQEIVALKTSLYEEHSRSNTMFIENYYQVDGKLPPGELFESVKAHNIHMPDRQVRIKVYKLPNLVQTSDIMLRKFRRSADSVSKLPTHPNILNTLTFFPDTNSPDRYYEVTEIVDGQRLDRIISSYKNRMPLKTQIQYIRPLCHALAHAHNHGVYHRNICPQTVFVTKDRTVKLADFDFAKLEGQATISIPGRELISTKFTAPEVIRNSRSASAKSDIYALGMLWYFLACLPEQEPSFSIERIEQLALPSSALELMKRMLAHQPHKRPSSALEIDEELQEILQSIT